MNEDELGQKIRGIIREEIKLFLSNLKQDISSYFSNGNYHGYNTGCDIEDGVHEIKNILIDDIQRKGKDSVISQLVKEAMSYNDKGYMDEHIRCIIISSLKEELEFGDDKALMVENFVKAIKEHKPTLYRVLREEANKTSRTDLIDLD